MLSPTCNQGATPPPSLTPPLDCSLCPRLVAFRHHHQALSPDWHNAPVTSFGTPSAQLAIIGLAPGLRGANRTGRPFTGDYAGDLLYATLAHYGWTKGTYTTDPNDDFQLVNARIMNSVRCVPPDNKPTTTEVKTCQRFLQAELAEMPNIQVYLTLGRIAHHALLDCLAIPRKTHPFQHQGISRLNNGRSIISSYHCSRYNTQTRRLTESMFAAVFADIQNLLAS
ncbi:MAG: uracil-DNA glycosylase [Proteobacteria bacterium]|nr:uracil-DNA glycosylase [Pseudomonadota bacterium]